MWVSGSWNANTTIKLAVKAQTYKLKLVAKNSAFEALWYFVVNIPKEMTKRIRTIDKDTIITVTFSNKQTATMYSSYRF